MKFRGLIVAAVVLAALTGTLYWSNHRKPEPEKASADAAPKILSLPEADITKVDVRKSGGEELTLSKDNAGKWQITAPQPMRADQSQVSSMVSALASLSSDRLVEEKATNLDTYGLIHPSAEIAVTGKGNKTHAVLIGDDTPTSSGAYAMLQDDRRVFTVPTFTKNNLEKSANDLRDKHLLAVDADKVSRLELVANKQDIEFGRNKDDWQIIKPEPLRADSGQVGDLVRKLADATMDASGNDQDEKKAAAAFAGGAPVATAKVTDEAGTQELQVRKNKDDYYAKSSAVAGVDDFRNKRLFDFGYRDPNKVEMHDGAKAYFLTYSGDNWWSADGKKMDPDSVELFVDKIRDLSAAKFVNQGFTAPAITLAVVSNDGKLMEKVTIGKSGDVYVAERQNDPAFYQLDASAVPDLQKAAADMKLAAAAGK